MQRKLALILAPLTITASSCNSVRDRPVVQHPTASDLACPAEPDAIALLEQDPTGLTFDKAVREAGEDCRRALARVCRWHKRQGMVIVCPAPLPGEES